MKGPGFAPIPWDMVVFLSITTIGFGYSIRNVMDPSHSMVRVSSAREVASEKDEKLSRVVDLGCLERRIRFERKSFETGTIKLKGKFCDLTRKELEGFAELRVRNLTNNQETTVFFQGENSAFSTEPMNLASGKNQLEVSWKVKDDDKLKSYTLEAFNTF